MNELHAIAQSDGERLDVFAARMAQKSRAQAQKLIEQGLVRVNGDVQKGNYRLREGEAVCMQLPAPAPLEVQREDIPLSIVYEDGDIAVIDKPQGMVVHPAPGHESGTMVNALLYALEGLSGIGGVMRPGIVHRIDKMTSGLIVVAKNDMAHASLCAQIKAHSAARRYLAIVDGCVKEDLTIDAPIGRAKNDRKKMAVVPGGREAITHIHVLLPLEGYTLVEARLETGRTHQIRVHMKHSRHPVAGDPLYGKARLGLSGQALHAYRLQLTHPRTGEAMDFYAPPPAYFLEALVRAKWDGTRVWETLE